MYAIPSRNESGVTAEFRTQVRAPVEIWSNGSIGLRPPRQSRERARRIYRIWGRCATLWCSSTWGTRPMNEFMNRTVCIPVPVLLVVAVIVIIWLIIRVAFPVRLWIAATAAGAPVPAATLLGMRLRRTNPRLIVEPYIIATKAGLPVDIGQLEAIHLAGGDVVQAVRDLIRAAKAGQPRTLDEIANEQLR